MALLSVEATSFARLLTDAIREGTDVYKPEPVGERWAWRRATTESLGASGLSLGPARASEPVKGLAFPPRGQVADFFKKGDGAEPGKAILVGVRACDLAALRVLDHIFLSEPFRDPHYAARRERMLVVSADCTGPYEVCFCTFVEGAPHPTAGYDLNLSEVAGRLVVETGSEKGEKFVEAHRGEFRDASDVERSGREEARRKVQAELEAKVRSQLLDFKDKVRHITRGREEHAVWAARAQDCVECGACNFVCPTCHFFYLLDVEDASGVKRFANWDSCLYPSFARVAGGANPRERRAERLLNRFEKKFSFFCDTMDALACTGCGRCVEACAGKIDLREVLKELAR